MKFEILQNGNLRIALNEKERAELREAEGEEGFHSDSKLFDILESEIGNSVFDWAQPEEIGALTSAPCLAIFGEPRPLRPGETVGRGNRLAGHWEGKAWVEDVEQAWAFMDYQVRSVQQDLLKKGEATFTSGN